MCTCLLLLDPCMQSMQARSVRTWCSSSACSQEHASFSPCAWWKRECKALRMHAHMRCPGVPARRAMQAVDEKASEYTLYPDTGCMRLWQYLNML